MGDYDTLVIADEVTLADLLERFYDDDGEDSHTLVAYAAEHGVTPPAEPAGYEHWTISVRYLPGEDDGRLYWLGPQPDHND